MHRYEIKDGDWDRIKEFLPGQVGHRGVTAKDNRLFMNAVLWIARTGAPWRDLPERYGPWSTVYSRFWRWRVAGIWDRVFAAVQQEEDAAGAVDWEVQFIDSSVIRAHQHAAGAKGGLQKPKRWGAVRAASRPRCTSRPRARANR